MVPEIGTPYNITLLTPMDYRLLRCSNCQMELGQSAASIVTLYADEYPSLSQSYRTKYDMNEGHRLVEVDCPRCGAPNQWKASGVRWLRA